MAKITSITPTGQWNEFFKFEVRFDDGDFGTTFAKSTTPPYAVVFSCAHLSKCFTPCSKVLYLRRSLASSIDRL